MAKLAVPPISPRLRQAYEPIVTQKCLDDDTKWRDSLLPLLLDRIAAIESQIRLSLTANANTPSTKTLDEITQTIQRIRGHLNTNFSTAAPFTIRRIAEIILHYKESEYSLSTVELAHKYLLALARLVYVQSKETAFREVTLSDNENSTVPDDLELTAAEYYAHGLPKDIPFTRLLWEDAPITETIMVKDKSELLERVSSKLEAETSNCIEDDPPLKATLHEKNQTPLVRNEDESSEVSNLECTTESSIEKGDDVSWLPKTEHLSEEGGKSETKGDTLIETEECDHKNRLDGNESVAVEPTLALLLNHEELGEYSADSQLHKKAKFDYHE